jgi:ADP-ribose pyrophosphatase YjhB (NUDIX family)
MSHDFKLSVNAIIAKDDEILLVKRSDRDMWRLPGGELALGETVDEAIVKMIHQKLGLTISIERVIGLYSKPIQNELVVLFLVKLINKRQTPKPSGNYVAADYYPVDKMPDNFPDKNYERVDDYKENYKDVVIRTQMSAPSSLKFPNTGK